MKVSFDQSGRRRSSSAGLLTRIALTGAFALVATLCWTVPGAIPQAEAATSTSQAVTTPAMAGVSPEDIETVPAAQLDNGRPPSLRPGSSTGLNQIPPSKER